MRPLALALDNTRVKKNNDLKETLHRGSSLLLETSSGGAQTVVEAMLNQVFTTVDDGDGSQDEGDYEVRWSTRPSSIREIEGTPVDK